MGRAKQSQQYELRQGVDGRIVCIDRNSGEQVNLGRCVSIRVGDDGATVQLDKSKCVLGDGVKLRDAAERHTRWRYADDE